MSQAHFAKSLTRPSNRGFCFSGYSLNIYRADKTTHPLHSWESVVLTGTGFLAEAQAAVRMKARSLGPDKRNTFPKILPLDVWLYTLLLMHQHAFLFPVGYFLARCESVVTRKDQSPFVRTFATKNWRRVSSQCLSFYPSTLDILAEFKITQLLVCVNNT